MAAPMKLTLGLCRYHSSLFGRQCSRLLSSSVASGEDGASLVERFRKASEQQQQSVRPLCRTEETQPANHGIRHEGLFYSVSPDDSAKYFGAVHPRVQKMRKAFDETCIMVRQPALEVMQYLQAANYDLPVVRYLLYGDYGAGKSSSLGHIMHYAGTQGWIVAHVPWAAFYNRTFGEIQLSSYRQGRVDLPIQSLRWLTYFRSVNAQILKDINITNRYVWTKRESAEVGDPIMEAIEFGISRPKYATDVAGLVVKELKLHATAKRLRVLFTVDGVNAFWQPTTIQRDEDRRLKYDGEELTLIHNFKKLLSNDWSNGAVVGVVDRKAQITSENESDLPRYLLGEKGFSHLEPFLPIKVAPYSQKEIHSALKYLEDRKWFSNPKAVSEEGKQEIIFLSQSNPSALMDVTAMW